MSFPFNTSDIHSTLNLITTIIASLHRTFSSASHTHFQSLVQELQALQRSLIEIDALAGDETQIPEISALKFASCGCKETLERFWERLRPFEDVLGEGAGKRDAKGAWKKTPRMVRWELLVRKEVPELRTYLVAHVGSLNLRLSTALLNTAAKSRAVSHEGLKQMEQSTMAGFEQLNADVLKIRDRVAIIPSEDTIPTLNNLLEMTTRVWQSNNLLIDTLAILKNQLPSPDLRYTWAQPPAILEDALGRYITIPSEYDWEKVEAIIHVQFRSGPGSTKVKSGEYELWDSLQPGMPLLPSEFLLRPGMRIMMAIVIGQYQQLGGIFMCPRIQCKFPIKTKPLVRLLCETCQHGQNMGFGSYSSYKAGIKDTKCQRAGCGGMKIPSPKSIYCQWCCHSYRVTSKQLFQPLKPLKFIFTPDQSSLFNPEYFRIERMSYKNISICLSELHADKVGLKKNLDSEKSKRGEFSQLPAHQVRVAKSAMVFQSIESTKMKLSHLSPSIQRLRRVRTRDLPRFSSPESVLATQSSSTKPLKLPPLPPLPDFRTPWYRDPAITASILGTGANYPLGSSPTKPSVNSMPQSDTVIPEAQEPPHIKTTASTPKKVWPQLPDLKEVVSRTPELHFNDIGVQERSCSKIWEAVYQVEEEDGSKALICRGKVRKTRTALE